MGFLYVGNNIIGYFSSKTNNNISTIMTREIDSLHVALDTIAIAKYTTIFQNQNISINDAKNLEVQARRYISSLSTDEIIQQFHNIPFMDIDLIWVLFDKTGLMSKIDNNEFYRILKIPHIVTRDLFNNSKVCKHYRGSIADYLRELNWTEFTSIIVILASIDKDYLLFEYLTYDEVERKLIDVIQNDPYGGILKYIINGRFNIDKLPKARKAIEDKIRQVENSLVSNCGEPLGYTVSIGKTVHDMYDYSRYERGIGFNIVYNIDWLSEHLDFPTILNNFIYIFNLVNRSMIYKIPDPAIADMMLLDFGKEIMTPHTTFMAEECRILDCIKSYYTFLNKRGIHLEDVVTWFFNEYIKKSFGIEGFYINKIPEDGNFFSKCCLTAIAIESAYKQYSCINISKKQVLHQDMGSLKIRDTKSHITGNPKYVYFRKKNLLSCDTSDGAKTLLAIGVMKASTFNKCKFDQSILDEVAVIKSDKKLFTNDEANLVSWYFNNDGFENALGLRNAYLHGSMNQFSDEATHTYNYMRLLRVMMLLIIKINDELCDLIPAKEDKTG